MAEDAAYKDGIYRAWVGELQGEMFFARMAQGAHGSEQREKWQTLAELERVTGRRMAALLEAHNVERAAPEPPGQLLEALATYAKMPYAEAVAALRAVVVPAIGQFEQLLAQAPAADREPLQFLVDHEQAILSFVEREAAGDKDAALDAARRLMASPVRGA